MSLIKKSSYVLVAGIVAISSVALSSQFTQAVVSGDNVAINLNESGQLSSVHPVNIRNLISDDGKVVVFASSSTGMQSSSQAYIYSRNIVTGVVKPIDISTNGVASNSALNNHPRSISYTGRYIVFESRATNLIDGVTIAPEVVSGAGRLYLRDTLLNTTTLIAKSEAGVISNGTAESSLGVSSDGRFISFTTNATNLHSDASDGKYHLYMVDTADESLTVLNRRITDGVPIGGTSYFPPKGDMSCDGSLVVFQGSGFNPAEDDRKVGIHLIDRRGISAKITNITLSATHIAGSPSISCNGDYIGFGTQTKNLDPSITAPLNYQTYRPYVYDRVNKSYHLVSVTTNNTVTNAQVCDTSFGMGSYVDKCIEISDSGLAVFQATDPGLTGASGQQIYLRDIANSTTELVSRDLAGNFANSWSAHPKITADGRRVIYVTHSTNLVAGINGPELILSRTGYYQ